MDRYSQGAAPPVHRGRPVSGMDAAHATEYFEHFMNATSMKTILGYYRRICEYLHLKPNVFPLFYPKLRAHVTSWKAKALLKKFDARASHKCYGKGKICANTRVLIIGAGPCGLRSAIEAQLLGAKVVVIEKRDRLSRNNVLHLWPFVIEDLRALGAKRFFGKFCAGAIDHISIRQLQCILLKIALVLGVEIHTEVSFEKMIEPNVNDKTGWRAEFKPADHPVSQYEFDVILAADGKRNTLHGFKRKEFRGKLAIAITANFINKKTEAEARVEEISGVAFIFNQKFFKDLYEETRIDLENIVYYKDDTHYFVMTAKKASLIEKGVIKQDLSDTEKLLGLENVDRDALQEYAKEAANFSTNYQMPNLEFAVNHYGQPDVAMFDFTSMYAAENASKTIERNGYQLLMILVGDSLLEPFWPTGSGCARGFLSSLDAAWAIRSWASPTTTALDVMAERESIYRLLAQTTPDNLNKDWKSYTLDPATRYPNLNKNVVLAHQVINLYETDNPDSIDQMRRNIYETPQIEMPKKRRRGDVDNEVLLSWISDQVKEHEDIFITDLESVLKDGKVLCAVVHHYRPDLLDYNAIKDGDPATNNQLAFDVLEKELGIPPIATGEEIINIEDYLTMASYLTQVYHTFRGEIPHIKHPKLSLSQISFDSMNSYFKSKLQTTQEKAKQIAECIQKTLNKQENNKWEDNVQKPLKDETYIQKSLNHINNTVTEENVENTPKENKQKSLNQHKNYRAEEIVDIPPKDNKLEKYVKEIINYNSVFLDNKSKNSNILNSSIKNDLLSLQQKGVKGQNGDCEVDSQKQLLSGSAKLKKHVKLKKLKKAKNNSNIEESTNDNISIDPIKDTDLKLNACEKQSLEECNNITDNVIAETKKKKRKRKKRSPFTFVLYPMTEIILNELPYRNNGEINKGNGDMPLKNEKVKKYITELNESCTIIQKVKEINESCSSTSLTKFMNLFPEPSIKDELNEKFENIECGMAILEVDNKIEDKLMDFQITEGKKSETITNPNLSRSSSLCLLSDIVAEKVLDIPEENRTINAYKVWESERNSSINIHIIEKLKDQSIKCQEIHYEPLKNTLTISSKSVEQASFECQKRPVKYKFHKAHKHKFSSSKNMNDTRPESGVLPDQIYSRVSTWISTHDFRVPDDARRADLDGKTVLTDDVTSDITSVTRAMVKNQKVNADGIRIEERTDEVRCKQSPAPSVENFTQIMKNMSCNKVIRTLSKFSNYSPFRSQQHSVGKSKPTTTQSKKFSVIVEGEETDLPESSKRTETTFKTVKLSDYQAAASQRLSSRHKRHADAISSNKPTPDRKTRKRRTLERVGASVVERQKVLEEISANRNERQSKRKQQRKRQTEQFLKSMQMLQANCKPDHSQPFEDYSIFLYRQNAPNFEERVKDLEKKFTYVPDHENKLPSLRAGNDEDLQARIKSLENKWKDPQPVDRKPKDLLRAIGKIDSTDWNIKEIEKKILENKLGKSVNKDKERVPKWSKEEFLARQTKMESKHLDRQDSAEAKFADIDKNIKVLDHKLKEGTVRDLGQNKVATITEKLVSKVPPPKEEKPVEKPVTRPPINLPTQAASEFCHFCDKRVYLMERLSAEGRFFHHGCFKCQYCHTQLRLGSYSFDRDGQYGHKFFCIHHYGMQGELPRSTKVVRKSSHRQPQQEISRSPEKKRSAGVAGLDLLDRVQTPERIEFANLSTGSVLSDVDEPLSQMDEDEWTDKNFGASCAEELDDSDDDSSSYSDTDSDDDAYDDALEEPATKEGTMRLAQKLKYYRKKNKSDSDGYSSSDQSSYDENSSDDDESDTATEGEDEIRARELRKQEVNVEPPVVHTDTGTDTEVVSDETSSESSSEVQNSATEISTDSEFAQDDPTPTREIPSITFNDCNVTKVRGSSGAPRRLQVTSGYLQKPLNGKKSSKPNIELKLSPLVPSAPIIKKPAPVLLPRTEGYALNRTQSTGGIAAKKSLELKKKYLLGESAHPGCIQKSGSASTLDNKFKNFQTDVSDYQKLLKPSAEISASMKVFCTKLDENYSSKISPSSSPQPISTETTQEETKNGYTSTPPLPPPDITKDTEKAEHYVFQNELEGRPRSPVHETSIIVPEIDWSKNKKSQTEESSSSESSSENELASTPNYDYTNIPKVEVHSAIDEEDIPPDSLCIIEDPKNKELEQQAEPVKSIASEKKSLNQPKSLPYLEKMLPEIHNSLHVRYKKEEPENTKTNKENVELETKSSGRSTPDSLAEQVTVALTETELSDWAREGEVSDDLEEFAEFELNEHIETNRNAKNPKNCMAENIKKADIAELDDFGHVCGKAQDFVDVKNMVLEDSCKSINVNFDNIEFMDTGTETSSDEGVVDSQNGYVLFKNDDEIPEDSLNPIINQLVEAKNEHLCSKLEGIKNTGYCIISNMENNFGSEVIDLKPSDLEKLKQKQAATEHEDDSLLIVDTGTTTEENTCSDSTVKNVSDIRIDKAKAIFENNNSQKQRLEEKLASVKAEQALLKQNSDQNKQSSHNKIIVDDVNLEFDEHCHRLQSKVDFGNAKDSIDIRKSRRKSKSEVTPKPDLIQEEKDKPSPVHAKKDITLNLTPTVRTPDVLYKKENIMKERDDNQRLIQEMVMNKMKAENKSLERRRRNRTPSKQYDLTKSATTDISQINLDNSNRNSTYSNASMYSTPDVLLSTNSVPLQLSHSVNKAEYSGRKENNKPTYNDSVFNDFQTPKAPPRTKHDDITRTSEKMKQVARERARLMSNEDLGLSPEDKFQRVKDKHCKKGKENTQVNNQSVENRNSWLHNNSFMKKKNNSTPKLHSTSTTNLTTAPTRTKSVSGISNNFVIANETPDALKMCKSDPNLLDTEDSKKKKTRGESFLKKSQSFLKKGQTFFKSLSPKKLDKSKETIIETPIIRKSYSEISSINHVDNDVSPPPIPPLPVNYTGNSIKGTDDSSDGEQDWKKHELSSCDNIDQSGMFESSITSVSSRRSKSSRKARQTQLKRHRMAQEIQRKLEETEVKTRELEKRGVLVEKALRGEDSEYSTKDESELLQEWFDLMRDRTELRRYEKELMVRAQELELEDRHARLQHDLRERLESDQKTEADSKAEESIITEMLDIVSKRDSLLAVMEEERLRYTNEDRDLEEQMLAKGLRLTPIRKSPEK